MVSILTFYSDDPSSNPADACIFCAKFVFEMNKIKQKEAKIGPLKTSIIMNGYLQSRSLANLVKVSPIGTIVG